MATQTFDEKLRKTLMVQDYYNNDTVSVRLIEYVKDTKMFSGDAPHSGCRDPSLRRAAPSQNGNQGLIFNHYIMIHDISKTKKQGAK